MPISEVYNIDCMTYMQSIPDERFRLECFGETKNGKETLVQTSLF